MLVKMPEVSSRDGAVVTHWYLGLNSRVEKGQDIVEVSSDKATFDVSSPCAGTIINIFKQKGQKAVSGEVIAEVRE